MANLWWNQHFANQIFIPQHAEALPKPRHINVHIILIICHMARLHFVAFCHVALCGCTLRDCSPISNRVVIASSQYSWNWHSNRVCQASSTWSSLVHDLSPTTPWGCVLTSGSTLSFWASREPYLPFTEHDLPFFMPDPHHFSTLRINPTCSAVYSLVLIQD